MGDSIVPRVLTHPHRIREILDSLHGSTPELSHVFEPLSADVCLSEDEYSQSDEDDEYITSTRHHLRVSSHACHVFEPCQRRTRDLEQLSRESHRADYVQFDPTNSSHGVPNPMLGSQNYTGSLPPTYDHSSSPRFCPPISNTFIASPDGAKLRRPDSPRRKNSLPSTKALAKPGQGNDSRALAASNSSIVNQQAKVSQSGTFASNCAFRPAVILKVCNPTDAKLTMSIQENSTLPQKERLDNVHRVIAGVEKVFVPKPTTPSLGSFDEPEAFSERASDHRGENRVQGGTLGNPKHDHTVTEPSDSPGGGGQHGGHDSIQLSGFPTGQGGGPIRHKHSGSDGRDRRGPYDRPNADRSPATSPNGIVAGRFCCIYNGPDNNDPDCKKYHKYVSELRVHHGGNRHQFFYCAVCFSTFTTEEQRDVHDPKHCTNQLCVTMGCPNFNSAPGPSCNHPGRTNPQIFVWIRLFQLARPDDQVPSNISVRVEPITPTAGPATAITPTVHDYTPVSQIGPSSSQHSYNAAPRTAVHCSDTPYTEALRTLALSLRKQLELLDLDGLEVLEDMYTSYLKDDTADFRSQCGSDNCTRVVTGLRKLCRRMWRAIRNPGATNATQVSQILDWAHGILSQSDATSRPKGKAPVRTIQSEELETRSPSEARNLRRQQSRSYNIANIGTQFSDHGQHVNTNPPNQHQDFMSGMNTYDQAMEDISTLFGLQGDNEPQPSENEAIMPWNINNNAESLLQDGVFMRSKTGDLESLSQDDALMRLNTKDSGYWTGRSC